MDVNIIHQGDCLDIMRQLPDNSIDTIITDPPYGLQFMGKEWDKLWRNETAADRRYVETNNGKLTSRQRKLPDYTACDNEAMQLWHYRWAKECLRVAKPGATLMAFGGSRTYHRLTCAIEDAGWQIRDCVVYFHDGNEQEAAFMASLNEEQLAAYLELRYPGQTMFWVYGSGFPKSLNIGKDLDRQEGAEREVIGKYIPPQDNPKNKWTQSNAMYNRITGIGKLIGGENEPEWLNITAPATPLAAKWDGWGTALKPAHEPIVLAMKPNEGYADNARKWGVSGLWIDGGRIKHNEPQKVTERNAPRYSGRVMANGIRGGTRSNVASADQNGRFPANLVHDGSEAVEAEFAKAGVRVSNNGKGPHRIQATRHRNDNRAAYGNYGASNDFVFGDSGSASRFFYTAKASPSERGEYNKHPTVKPLELIKYLVRLTKTPDGGVVLDPFAGSGTTGLACLSEGRDYILIEREADYCEIARRRIAEYAGQEIQPKEIKLEAETVKQLGLW